jgi:hypothetical protein
MAPRPSRPAKDVRPVDPTLPQFGLGFVPHHPLVSYYLWLCLMLDILKICMDFGPYDAFLSFDVPEMINQQNLWNSLVISTYLLYLEWNLGMLVIDMSILWSPIERMGQFHRKLKSFVIKCIDTGVDEKIWQGWKNGLSVSYSGLSSFGGFETWTGQELNWKSWRS